MVLACKQSYNGISCQGGPFEVWKHMRFSATLTSNTHLAIWKSMILCVTEKNSMILYVTESMILYVTDKICMILYITSRVWYNMYDTLCTSSFQTSTSSNRLAVWYQLPYFYSVACLKIACLGALYLKSLFSLHHGIGLLSLPCTSFLLI